MQILCSRKVHCHYLDKKHLIANNFAGKDLYNYYTMTRTVQGLLLTQTKYEPVDFDLQHDLI